MKILFIDPNDRALVVSKVTYASYSEELEYDNIRNNKGFHVELEGGAEIGIPYLPKELCDKLVEKLFNTGMLDIKHHSIKWLE